MAVPSPSVEGSGEGCREHQLLYLTQLGWHRQPAGQNVSDVVKSATPLDIRVPFKFRHS